MFDSFSKKLKKKIAQKIKEKDVVHKREKIILQRREQLIQSAKEKLRKRLRQSFGENYSRGIEIPGGGELLYRFYHENTNDIHMRVDIRPVYNLEWKNSIAKITLLCKKSGISYNLLHSFSKCTCGVSYPSKSLDDIFEKLIEVIAEEISG